MFDGTLSVISTDVCCKENKRMRHLETTPNSMRSNLFDFDAATMPDEPTKSTEFITMRRTSLGVGNGDLVSLISSMLSLPVIEDDGNPFEPTPIQELQDTSFGFGIDNIGGTKDKGAGFEDFPSLGGCENSFGWFSQDESQTKLANFAAAFAA